MEHIYPTFERGRILKKESLWALRDYSYTALELQYQEYTDGVIFGCMFSVEGNELCISAGMIKCHGFIYLIVQQKLSYRATNEMQYLKFVAMDRQEQPGRRHFVKGDHGRLCKKDTGLRDGGACGYPVRLSGVTRQGNII